MNGYAILAWLVDFIHLLLIIYYIGGFFLSIKKHYTFRLIHSISFSALLPTQLVFKFNCPLVLLGGHVRELAYPVSAGDWYYQSFIVPLIRNRFGVDIPEILITIVTLLGSVVAVCALVYILKSKQENTALET